MLPASEHATSRRASPCRWMCGPRVLLVVCGCAVLLLVLLFPFPVGGRIWTEVFNLGHAPAFLLLQLLISGLLDPGSVGLPGRWSVVLQMSVRRQLGLAAGLTMLGVTGEYLQRYSGRHASLGDLAANTCGVLAGWLLLLALQPGAPRRRRLTLPVCAAAVLTAVSLNPLLELWDCLQQWRGWPVLSSLERQREMSCWYPVNADIQRSADWAADGVWSLKVQLRPGGFSGATFQCTWRDWSSASALQVGIRNPSDSPLTLVMKIMDAQHAASGFAPSDRFQREFVLPPQSESTLRVPLVDVLNAPAGRRLQLHHITQVELFCAGLTQPAVLYVDGLSLTAR